jgi:hypothetical protein
MKLTTGILGCALATGLMIFAADKAQASLVISNTVYAPMKLKLQTQYIDGNKWKKASITSKQWLKDQGYNDKVQLAVNTDTYDIWVVNKDTLVANLSTNDMLTLNFYLYNTAKPNSNKESYQEKGLIEIYTDNEASVDAFDVSGPYSDNYSYGKTDKNGDYNYKENASAKNLSGTGNVPDLSEGTLTVTGSASWKGNGKLAD